MRSHAERGGARVLNVNTLLGCMWHRRRLCVCKPAPSRARGSTDLEKSSPDVHDSFYVSAADRPVAASGRGASWAAAGSPALPGCVPGANKAANADVSGGPALCCAQRQGRHGGDGESALAPSSATLRRDRIGRARPPLSNPSPSRGRLGLFDRPILPQVRPSGGARARQRDSAGALLRESAWGSRRRRRGRAWCSASPGPSAWARALCRVRPSRG